MNGRCYMNRVHTVIVVVLTVLSMVVALGCSGGEAGGAIVYNDSIINHQNKVVNKMMALVETFGRKDHAEMTGKLGELNEALDKSITAVKAMEGYKGDTSLRDAIAELMEFYKDIFSNEYKEMIDIIGSTTPLGPDDVTRMQTIQKEVAVREKVLDDNLARVQREFAQKYNIQIKKNELQKEIDNL